MSHKNFALYHSGKKGTDYFDVDNLIGDPNSRDILYNKIIEQIAPSVSAFDKLVFLDKDYGPVGIIVFASEVANEFEKQLTIVKLQKNIKFNNLYTKGSKIEDGDSILLIDDVIKTGKTQNKAINILEEQGGIVEGIFSVYVGEKEKLHELESEHELTFAESIVNHRDFEEAGIALSDEYENYIEGDYTQEFGSLIGLKERDMEVLTDKLDSEVSEIIDQAAKQAVEELDEFSKKQTNISVNSGFKNVMKNAYLRSIIFLNQKNVFE